MLILRKYSKKNKIKNRYIITMGYKSKKIHKRRYFKSLQKRQSRKSMYGGDVLKPDNDVLKPDNDVLKPDNYVLNNDVEADKIMKKIEDQNKIEIPSILEIPVVGTVVKKTGDLFEGAAVKGLDIMGKSIGVDIDNPQSFGEKLDNIKTSLTDPTNVEKTKEILGNAGKYVEVGIDAVAPVFEKTADKILPVVMKETDKAVESGLGTLVNLAEDVAGPIIGIPRTLLSAAEAFNASVNAGSELIKGTAEVIQGTQENFNKKMDETMSSVPETSKEEFTPEIKSQDSSLKKIQNEAEMIGGRTDQSRLEFLTPHVNSSQIMRQYGGKWQTKRRNKNRKHASRRR